MDKLSVEILMLIFKDLHYTQKLQCKLVCRAWARILRSGLDLQNLMIPRKWSSPLALYHSDYLIESIQNETLNGKECRRLALCGYYDRDTLFKLFPNVTSMCFLPDDDHAFQIERQFPYSDYNSVYYFQNWRGNLKIFMEFNCIDNLCYYLSTGVFEKLTTIILYPEYCTVEKRLSTLLDSLKNAPNLTKLVIKTILITIGDLENLHVALPFLHSLMIVSGLIKLNQELPTNIIPAKSMKKLELMQCFCKNGFSLSLSKYIALKYPNLQKFDFSVDTEDVRERNYAENEWESSFLHLIRTIGTNLTSFKARLMVASPLVFTELNEKSTGLKDLDVNVFFNTKVLYDILNLDMTRNIHSLSLDQVPSLEFNLFKKLNNLKKLCLGFEEKKYNRFSLELNTIVNDLPLSLEELELTHADICLDLRNTSYRSSIKRLEVRFAEIKNDLSECLSYHFPQLTSLVIDHCDLLFSTLDLENRYLSFVYLVTFKHLKVTIGDTSRSYDFPLSIPFILSSYVRRSFFDVHDHSMYSVCEPLAFSDTLPHLHFKCANVQTLLYHGCLVV